MTAIQVEIEWHPSMSIYASESFLRVVGNEYGWIGGIDDFGKLRCVLPFTIVRKAILRMVPFRFPTIPLEQKLSLQEDKSFLNSAINYLRSTGGDLIIPASTNTLFRTYPDGAVVAPYGTFMVDLTQREETLWGNLSASHRRKIRVASKSDVQIRSGIEYLETAYKLVRDTFKRSRMPFMGLSAFKRILLGLGGSVKVFVAVYQGAVQGCTVIPFSEYCAYYVYGGSIPHPVTGSMNRRSWEAIRRFRTLRVKRYDFVGTRIKPEKGS